MRIVSLLPSLTELVAFLGRADDLVGVTHECDEPASVSALPKLTSSVIPGHASAAEIDRAVSGAGGSLYRLDAELLGGLRPDLIVTQSQCDVCAVSEPLVRQVAASLPGSPPVESVNPLDLAGVFSMFRRVGDLLDRRVEAESWMDRFNATATEIALRRGDRPRPRVLHLEWADPPFISGHWNPELVGLAGGREVLGRAGRESSRVSWDEVAGLDPEVVLFAPCGFPLGRVEREWAELRARPEWRALPFSNSIRVALIDGNRYFSRPGPRLEESLRIAAAAIDPATCLDLAPPGDGWRWVTEDLA
ncbi:MAG: cobalamin-binding protein [Isosphaeraceae bacterium]